MYQLSTISSSLSTFEKLKECPDDDDLLPLYLSKRRVAPRRSPTGKHVCSNQSHPNRAGKIELIQEDNSLGDTYVLIDRGAGCTANHHVNILYMRKI